MTRTIANIPEIDLNPTPRFYVQDPDGRKDWPEIDRQATYFNLMRMAAPKVLTFPIPNAGRRNPRLARKEGIMSGIFDVCVLAQTVDMKWKERPLTAYIEFKGYTKAGRAGKLTLNQIDFGNRLHDMGIPCACFYSPHKAVDWLRDKGFPIARIK